MAQAVEQSTPAGTALSTIGELWRQGVDAGRSRAAFLVREADGWREVGWDEAAGRVTALANGFLALDVEKGDKVAILCRTRVEWTLADYALATIGAVVIPIYPTSSAAEIEFILGDSEAEMLIAEDAEQLAKMDEFETELPALERVIGIDVAGPDGTLADVEAAGRAYAAEHPDALDEASRPGRPRRHADVPLHVGHHRQPEGLRAQPAQLRRDGRVDRAASTNLFREDDTVLLFLPLAHNFARLVQFLGPAVGFTLAYCARRPRGLGGADGGEADALPERAARLREGARGGAERGRRERRGQATARRVGVRRRAAQGEGRRAARCSGCRRGSRTSSCSARCARGWAAGCATPSPAARRSRPRSPSSSTPAGS